MQTVASPRVILLEFNELCPSFLNEFMARGLLPNFQKLHDTSTVYVTDAGEEPPNLEPWIQWVTIHSGRPFADHRVFHLGDGRAYKGKLVGQLLSEAGVRVGIFGSMNTNYEQLNGYVIPDPWDVGAKASPDWLAPFYDTVATQVQESSRKDSFSKTDMARFGKFLVGHGLRPETGLAVARQLLAERLDSGVHWRRACTLEHVSYDLFRWLNRRCQVQFATFFANSTAHFQHYYWRNLEPGRFQIPPADKDHPSLRTAIEYGYQSMDRLVGKMLRDYPKSKIIMATALSQQAWDTKKCTFRPTDFDHLLRFAGVTDPYEIKPVMAQQFRVLFQSAEAAERAAGMIRNLKSDGDAVMEAEREDCWLMCGSHIIDYAFLGRQVTSATGRTERFDKLFYLIHGLRSGRHHPDGAFWVRNHQPRVVAEKVPLVNVAPAILHEFGVPVPREMACPGADLDRLTDRDLLRVA